MKKYENISLWRALSCVGVLLYHIFLQASRNEFSFGKYGVLFFFLITGFLAFSSKDIYENTKLYWVKRSIRIIPMYAAILLVWMILFSVEEKSVCKGWKIFTEDFVGGTWTMWVTMVFYVVAPLLVRIVNSYARAVVMLFAFCMPRYIYMVTRLKCLDKTMQYLCFCVGGGLIYCAFKEEKERMTVFLLSLTIICLKLSGLRDDYFFYFFVFMIIFIATRYMQIRGEIFRKCINLIDRYSYNIYLIHPIVLYLLRDYKWYITIPGGISGTFVLAWMSYKSIDEKMGIRLKRKTGL